MYGSVNCAKLLIEKGANLNALTAYFKETPLHLAIQEGKEEIVQLLLQKNADPNIRNYEGENSVFCAIRWNRSGIIEMIIDGGADPNFYNKQAASPLHVCVDYDAEEEARTLMLKGADPNYQDSKGMTPFHVAAERKCAKMASLFFQSGADPDVRDAELRTVWETCGPEFKQKIYPSEISKQKDSDDEAPPAEDDGKQWLRERKCFVCKTNDANRVLLPCRHLVLCHLCSAKFLEQFTYCPECEMAVYAAVKP